MNTNNLKVVLDSNICIRLQISPTALAYCRTAQRAAVEAVLHAADSNQSEFFPEITES